MKQSPVSSMRRFIWTVIGVLVAISIANAAERDRGEPGIPGCYGLSVGALTMPGGEAIAQPSPAWPPPARIKLSATALSPQEQEAHFVHEGFAVRPDRVAPGHWIFELGTWTSHADGSLSILWNG